MPRLLDLFCGAGGAGMGYYRAGFLEVIGVDITPQPRYPFEFVMADALEYVAEHGHEFDLIHASPPCQRYSRGSKQSHSGHLHPDMIAATREALVATGRPYVIENVADARKELRAPLMLCGAMFPGLRTYRHRLFESSVFLWSPPHPKHLVKSPRSNIYVEGQFMTIYGHVSPTAKAREVMGIDWPMSQYEIVQAIPPVYAEFIGRQILAALTQDELTMTAFDTAQAEYDAMQPPEYCPHDNDLTYFTMDSGHRYLVCADCFEIIPDPEEED